MSISALVATVAVAAPLDKSLSYLVPESLREQARIGMRLRVPLGRRSAIGYLLALAPGDSAGLKQIAAVFDEPPLFPPELVPFFLRAADYYRYPLGEVIRTALPAGLSGSNGRLTILRERIFSATGRSDLPSGARQREIVAWIRERGVTRLTELRERFDNPHAPLKRLVEQGYLTESEEERRRDPFLSQPVAPDREVTPTVEQERALAALEPVLRQGGFAPFLLHGVTGSGKTEVYLQAIARVLEGGRRALVLVPEIALTPQLVGRFRSRFQTTGGAGIAVLHSGLSDGERYDAWRAIVRGEVRIVIGARSAVFAPLSELGIVVVDEEHEGSYKQGEGFRYHGRDLAVYRAHAAGVPVVLGSATPSLESLANVRSGRYRRLSLPARAGGASLPRLRLADVRGQRLDAGLSNRLIATAREHLDAGGQVLFFLNRRGFAPVMLCHACGDPVECRRCSARMTYHRGRDRLVCHHCGAERPVPETCPACGAGDLIGLGKGTERLEAVLAEHFPGVPMVRVDRDSTRRRGRLSELMEQAASGAARILVGTQMLAKGHDFKALTLAAIVDADQGLYGVDFRAPERMAQLIVQVAGRAGRGERGGEVLIQTRHPDHPLLAELLRSGYAGFADSALAEREAAELPPFGAQALVRAEATHEAPPRQFLDAAAQVFAGVPGVRCLGPAPAPMLRRAGRYRYQLLLEASERGTLQRVLTQAYPRALELPAARRVRVALDVDPVDLT